MMAVTQCMHCGRVAVSRGTIAGTHAAACMSVMTECCSNTYTLRVLLAVSVVLPFIRTCCLDYTVVMTSIAAADSITPLGSIAKQRAVLSSSRRVTHYSIAVHNQQSAAAMTHSCKAQLSTHNAQ
jgi:hypothetical protein